MRLMLEIWRYFSHQLLLIDVANLFLFIRVASLTLGPTLPRWHWETLKDKNKIKRYRTSRNPTKARPMCIIHWTQYHIHCVLNYSDLNPLLKTYPTQVTLLISSTFVVFKSARCLLMAWRLFGTRASAAIIMTYCGWSLDQVLQKYGYLIQCSLINGWRQSTDHNCKINFVD